MGEVVNRGPGISSSLESFTLPSWSSSLAALPLIGQCSMQRSMKRDVFLPRPAPLRIGTVILHYLIGWLIDFMLNKPIYVFFPIVFNDAIRLVSPLIHRCSAMFADLYCMSAISGTSIRIISKTKQMRVAGICARSLHKTIDVDCYILIK